MRIADQLLNPAGNHSRQHHAECHKTGTDSVVSGFVFAVGEVNQVKHIRRKSESVAKLLDADS